MHLLRLIAFCLLFFLLSTPILLANLVTSETQIKATVLNEFIGPVETPDHTYGLDLPKGELRQIEDFLGHRIKLYPITEYIHLYRKSGRELVDSSFSMKIENQTPSQATVFIGEYPVTVWTKYGWMPCYTTDWNYHLVKQKDRWVIISKEITGES